jgi:hypothetical protein
MIKKQDYQQAKSLLRDYVSSITFLSSIKQTVNYEKCVEMYLLHVLLPLKEFHEADKFLSRNVLLKNEFKKLLTNEVSNYQQSLLSKEEQKEFIKKVVTEKDKQHGEKERIQYDNKEATDACSPIKEENLDRKKAELTVTDVTDTSHFPLKIVLAYLQNVMDWLKRYQKGIITGSIISVVLFLFLRVKKRNKALK